MSDPAEDAKRILDVQQGFQEIAKMAFSIYAAFRKAGFSDKQALYMTSEWIINITKGERK